ncbi:hypothetical protein [Peribacillus loiseleuriae]|uniref:hypothetical protein n=1 Tax=Peribacillus loiseleuriae TaxID=1679170 RepID=UPI003D010AB5
MEYQIIILNADKLFVVMEYEILPSIGSTMIHRCSQDRFKDIDSARKRANGMWQERKDNNKNHEIFTEAK